MADNWSHEENTTPLHADRRDFDKVESGAGMGCRTIGWMINVKPPLPSHCRHGRLLLVHGTKETFVAN